MYVIPLHIVESLLTQGAVFSDDLVNNHKIDNFDVKNVSDYSIFLINMSLKFYDLNQFSPLILGVSCIILARKLSNFVDEWNHKFYEITSLKYEDIYDCLKFLLM